MCEILVKAVDATHRDPIKDTRGCYKRGDVVIVKPDGWEWGTEEVLPPAQGGKFFIVKVPGVDPATLASLVGPELGLMKDVLRRRSQYLAVDTVWSGGAVQTLRNAGSITVTAQQLNNVIAQKASIG